MLSNASSSSWKEILLNGHKNNQISSSPELLEALKCMLRELYKILPLLHQKKGFFSKNIQSAISGQILSECIGKVMGSSGELIDYIGKLMIKEKMIELDGDSDSLLSEKKNVKFLHPYLPRLVIVGGGHAGLTSAIQLHEYFSIVLIDKNDHISLKPGFPIIFDNVENANKISVKYSDCMPSSVSFVRGLTKVVREDGVFIELIDKDSQTNLFSVNTEQANDELKNCKYLTFDYLVISTGCNSWRNLPNYDGRGGDNSIFYADSYDMNMLKVAVNTISQSDDSKAVVLIGGGIVGSEFFGALALGFPKKKIYMIQRSELLMKPNQDAHNIAMETFGKMKNGTILLNSQVDRQSDSETLVVKSLESGEETSIKCSVCILASGTAPNSTLMKDYFASSLDEYGYIKVNSSFQLFKSNSEFYRNIFVLGDVSNLDSLKLMQNANFQAEKFIEIAKLILQKQEKDLPTYQSNDARVMAVSLGPKYGFVMKEDKVMFKSGIVIKLKGFIQSSTVKGYSKQAKK